MVRPGRQLTRLFFILVLAAALFGGWYAGRTLEPDLSSLTSPSVSDESTWSDLLSAVGEEAIQLFLGLTSNR